MAIYNTLVNENLIFVTNPPRGTSYIMPDGKYLDMIASKELLFAPECGNRDIITHPTLDFYCLINNLVDKHYYKVLMHTDNAIALNDGFNFKGEHAYFVLPETKPTTSQYTSLLNWLDYIMTISPTVQIEDERKRIQQVFVFQKLDNDGWLPEDIIKEIKRRYSEQ